MRPLIILSLTLLTGIGCSSGADDTVVPSEAVDEQAQAATINVDPYKELMIVHPSVVGDEARTSNALGGHWSFRWLMERLSADSGLAPGVFVENWLQQFHATTVPGTSIALRDRAGVDDLLKKWKRDSSGRLDLKQSPFRLLAITNRVDKGKSLGDMGEGRFVFTLVDPETLKPSATGPDVNQPMSMTVILEFRLPGRPATPERDDYQRHRNAQRWHALGSIPFGTSYNAALEAITDAFVTTSGPRSLNQLRTNEIALAGPTLLKGQPGPLDAPGAAWELREYKLVNGKLAIVPVQATAGGNFNGDPTFARYLLDNKEAVLAGTLDLGNFAGYVASEEFDATRWTFPRVDGAPFPEDVRFAFAKGTCNGCHNAEQASFAAPKFPGGASLGFLHVSPFATTKLPASDPLAGTERVSAFLKEKDLPRRVTFMKGVLHDKSSLIGATSASH